MMTKNKSKSVGYKIAMVPLLAALLFYFISCSNESNESVNSYNGNKSEWWTPILKKHNIEPSGFNNFENVFEMGSTNSIDNKIVKLDNAIFLIKQNDEKYIIIKSPLAYHDLTTSIIKGDEGTIETYSFASKDTKPLTALSLKNFKYQFRTDKVKWDSWDAKEIDIIATTP